MADPNKSDYYKRINARRDVYDSYRDGHTNNVAADYVPPQTSSDPVPNPPRHAPGWYATVLNENKRLPNGDVERFRKGLYWDGQNWLNSKLGIVPRPYVLCDSSMTYANEAEADAAAQQRF